VQEEKKKNKIEKVTVPKVIKRKRSESEKGGFIDEESKRRKAQREAIIRLKETGTNTTEITDRDRIDATNRNNK